MFQAMQTKQDVWVQQKHHFHTAASNASLQEDPGGVVRFLESLDGDLHELKLCLFSPQKPLGFSFLLAVAIEIKVNVSRSRS